MQDAIASVRRFNRFFTKYVGALASDFLETGMTLAEARILFEIANSEACFADSIQHSLDLDAGFVSRVLSRFERRKWIRRSRIERDGRRRSIQLSGVGRRQFEQLDRRQHEVVKRELQRLDRPARARLVAALDAARDLLEGRQPAPFTIRTFQAGDLGLIASRQSIFYRERYGWSSGIEVNICQVVTAFVQNFKPGREQCWIAEVDGELAGSIFLTDEGDGNSRLRLLYVEPGFQRRGIGDGLVSTCLNFARLVGYRCITLWTHSILESARRIYTRYGFRKVEEKQHTLFGKPLLGETWTLQVDPPLPTFQRNSSQASQD